MKNIIIESAHYKDWRTKDINALSFLMYLHEFKQKVCLVFMNNVYYFYYCIFISTSFFFNLLEPIY